MHGETAAQQYRVTHCTASQRMPPPARYLRSHAEGLLLEGGEPGLRPLLITAGKDGGVACRVVHRDRRPSRSRTKSLATSFGASNAPLSSIVVSAAQGANRNRSVRVGGSV